MKSKIYNFFIFLPFLFFSNIYANSSLPSDCNSRNDEIIWGNFLAENYQKIFPKGQ